VLFDLSRSYTALWAVSLVLALLAGALSLGIRREPLAAPA
jgi:hypothetical protein